MHFSRAFDHYRGPKLFFLNIVADIIAPECIKQTKHVTLGSVRSFTYALHGMFKLIFIPNLCISLFEFMYFHKKTLGVI